MSYKRQLETLVIPFTEPGRMSQERVDTLNLFRKSKGMMKLKSKHRDCLRCERNFLSAGPQNRMCRQCLALSLGPAEGSLMGLREQR